MNGSPFSTIHKNNCLLPQSIICSDSFFFFVALILIQQWVWHFGSGVVNLCPWDELDSLSWTDDRLNMHGGRMYLRIYFVFYFGVWKSKGADIGDSGMNQKRIKYIVICGNCIFIHSFYIYVYILNEATLWSIIHRDRIQFGSVNFMQPTRSTAWGSVSVCSWLFEFIVWYSYPTKHWDYAPRWPKRNLAQRTSQQHRDLFNQ